MTTDTQPIDPKAPLIPWSDQERQQHVLAMWSANDLDYSTPAERRALRIHFATVKIACSLFLAGPPRHTLKGI